MRLVIKVPLRIVTHVYREIDAADDTEQAVIDRITREVGAEIIESTVDALAAFMMDLGAAGAAMEPGVEIGGKRIG